MPVARGSRRMKEAKRRECRLLDLLEGRVVLFCGKFAIS